ncbi:GAF domain-containing sensor histidine kinase [Nannocystis exedens]|nr:GAF domain-containing sensor histidine kinase [Nannocystis exedens]
MIDGNVEAIAQLITEPCARLLAVERVNVWLFDDTETQLQCIDQFNLSTGEHSSGGILHEHEFVEEFQALKSSLYVDASDPYTDRRTAGYVEGYLRPNRITSMLDAVIRFGGQNLGTICFEHVDKPHVWQQHEIDFACMISIQLSILLERRALRRTEEARREIQARLEATQELDALKTQFLANVSHELRTPLTLLLGPVEGLLSGVRDAPTEWQREELGTVRRSALRLLDHVNALLYFVRVGAGQVDAVFEPTDLAALTRELVGLFEFAAAKAQIRLQVSCESQPEPGYVDRSMWEKIVCNLVANALKYTFVGEIDVVLRRVGDNIELSVRDTGIGIPPEAMPHIFGRFYRVRGSRGRSAEGAGIGLALAKELVELHGGTIRAESTPDCGSIFTVQIPRGHAHLPAERLAPAALAVESREAPSSVDTAPWWLPGAPAPCEPPGTVRERSQEPERALRPRIVVADDNAEMRAYLMRLLSDRYAVEAVADGAEALAAVRARPADLVISDVMMPRLDGLDLLRALRSEASTSSTPVILVSARSGEESAVEALSAHADDYLCKPFSARELLARVGTHLELVRTRRAAAESALKDVFLGTAAHELWTPLTSLKLRVQLLQRKLEEPGGVQTAAKMLSGIDRSIARMEELTQKLLCVSAIQSGQLAVHRERSDLVAICREAAAEESAAYDREVILELPRAPVEAFVDRGRIGEVLKCLLCNALKFSPCERPVTMALREQGPEAVFVVRDQGPGIPPEEVPHIFDRFYRVPGIDVQVGSSVGLGLGLYIASAVVKQHEGRIEVETNPGQGSTFRVTLPR